MYYKDSHEYTDKTDMQHYLRVNNSNHDNNVKLQDYT